MGLGLLGGQPHRPAPDPLRSEGHGGGHLTTAANTTRTEHRHPVADRVDDLGDQHHRPDLAGVTTGFGPLCDHQIDAGRDMAFGMLGLAGQRADESSFFMGSLEHVSRGRAERVDDERGSVSERDLELRRRALGGEGCRVAMGSEPALTSNTVGQLGHIELVEESLDEGSVLVGNHADEVLHPSTAAVTAGVLRRCDQIDAVGAITDLVLDPVEVDLELAVGVADRPEHTEAPGTRHRRDDVSAVAESEDRQVDTEHLRDTGLHELSPFLPDRYSDHVMPWSPWTSRGRPSTCSATMLRWTAKVPPPRVSAGAKR